MKKLPSLLLFVLFYFVVISMLSAQQNNRCASHSNFEHQMHNPKFAQIQNKIETNYRNFLKSGMTSMRSGEVRTIPVYVHVIYNTAQENISDAQIQSQIDVLNEDYSATNGDIGNVPSEFAGSVANYQMQFELVSITRKYATRTEWGTDDDMKKSSKGGVDPITPDTHMNMWICNIGGGILGYAQFPGGAASTDGVVFSPQYCGSIDYDTNNDFYLAAPFNKGRTATHEVGHYLNLRHIWGDGNCNADDFVSDTPKAASANYNCPSYPSKSCNNNGGFSSDMFMNYMDYVDDACMFMFSEGQKARSYALFESGGARENLGYISGGSSDTQSPTAPNLSASNTTQTSTDLSWSGATDNVGVTSYDIYQGGALLASTASTNYTVNGLSASTSYSFTVKAKDAAGNVSANSNTVNVTTDGGSSGNCYTSAVTLSLTFDNYPAETSWSLTSGGSTIASGSGYSAKNATISEVFSLGNGDYTFTINDSYGDGICCNYGNGSYTLTDGSGSQIVTGGAIGSSETTNFCIGGGNTPDTEAPTAPSLSASNTTETSTTLSWSGATDNVGVTEYDVYQGGSIIGSTSSTSISVTALSAATSYSFTVKAKDAAGNESAASNSVSVTTPDTTSPSAPTLSAANTTETTTDLSWSGATDNVGITGYDVYQNGSLIGSTASSGYNVTGLSASTSYTFTVKAKDAAGNESASSNSVSVTTTAASGGNCYTSNVTLSLTFDNYPAETSWTLTSGGSTVASGNGYSNANTTITEVFTLNSGDYTFTINDSYGDGICCNYGNGSYTLTDGSGTQIVTGGAIGSSEATDFCIGGAAPAPLDYCDSKGNSVSDEWIAGVTVGSFTNNSGANGGYADNTNMTANINTGSVAVNLTPGFAGSAYNEYWRIWIDLNQDGDFSDANELVFDAGSTSNASVSGSMSVPSSANGITTRMRVSMKYNAAPTACETFNYGEVEDYTVSISSGAKLIETEEINNNIFEDISEIQFESKMYPNPATSFTNIELVIPNEDKFTISVYNLQGKEVYTISESNHSGLFKTQIELDNMKQGIYVVTIIGNGFKETKKLIVR